MNTCHGVCKKRGTTENPSSLIREANMDVKVMCVKGVGRKKSKGIGSNIFGKVIFHLFLPPPNENPNEKAKGIIHSTAEIFQNSLGFIL